MTPARLLLAGLLGLAALPNLAAAQEYEFESVVPFGYDVQVKYERIRRYGSQTLRYSTWYTEYTTQSLTDAEEFVGLVELAIELGLEDEILEGVRLGTPVDIRIVPFNNLIAKEPIEVTDPLPSKPELRRPPGGIDPFRP